MSFERLHVIGGTVHECQVCFTGANIRGAVPDNAKLAGARRAAALAAPERLSPERVWRVTVERNGMRIEAEVRACHWHAEEEVAPVLREAVATARRALELEALNG